ncbi:MAG TPA: MFS transporter [Oscillatoriales cyanobacterium M59_W2019_021]|nr:MFS transporter [Oscillatoriales cyanobacterium M4454_W2019_049]HIK50239.1 MFS transporter [Oscillatoriales cyanobacterium M59_W2019_021]
MWILWALSAGLIALDGFDFFIIGVAMPFIQRDFEIGAATTGAIAVAAVAGAFAGSLLLGPLADKLGRQRMLELDIALFVIASAATALAWNAESLIAFRFLVGIAIGADYPISVSYITENVPARFRGTMVISAFSFQAIGALSGALVGLATLAAFQHGFPDSPDVTVRYAWRLMLGFGLILSIAIGLLRLRFLLESPLYYISRNEYDKASKAASELLEYPIEITPETDPPENEPSFQYAELFSPPFLKRTVLASVPWFLQDIATYGIGIFTPTIVAALAYSGDIDFIAREMSAAKGSAFVDLFLIIGFWVAIALVDRVGRISLQIVGFLGMAAGLSVLSLSGAQDATDAPNLLLLFGGFGLFNLMMNAGPNSTTFLLSGEVFPTSIRSSGAGFAAAFAKAGAVLGTFILPILQHSVGVPQLLRALALICAIAAIITYFFRIETRGRSLEDVSLVLSNKS